MKRILTMVALSLGSLLLTISCGEDFLEKPPQGRYNEGNLANATGVEGLLVGAYGALDGIPVAGPGWHGAVSNWVFGGIASDDAYKGTDAGDQPEQTFIERYVWLSQNDHIRGKWSAVYNGVSRTNLVIKMLPAATDLSEQRAQEIVAEARFLRGLYHFEAKKMWNNIPYIDDEAFDPGNVNSVKIPNTMDAWPMIEADFSAAMQVLPATQSEPGRATRYSAMAMLAKCYMFQGFDLSSGAARLDKLSLAKPLLDEIIASGQFSLTNTYHENFSAGSRNNQESIFEVQYSLTAAADGGGNQGDGLAWPYNNGPGGCCGFYQPSQNLVNAHKTDEAGLPLLDTFNNEDVKNDEGLASDQAFEIYQGNVDPRLDWNVGRRYIPYLDWSVHPGADWIRDVAYAGPYSPKKHIAEQQYSGISGWQNLNANNYRMIRYAHVLLWRAEIAVEENQLDVARDLVNQVRARAANPEGFVYGRVVGFENNNFKNPILDETQPAANYVINTYDAAWTDQALARKAVRFEHRLEFAMEGSRFFDLTRWGIAAEVLNAYIAKERIRRTYLGGAVFQKGKHEFYPIPEREINVTTISGEPTLVQNPGYE
jgi:hypothetical protein